ncbi:MAG: hypothetical protein HY941_12745 [Gammaproteobacteria bacterium]|nr:hypothetical protein [Gammaproteobacteria bacterium]
MLKLTVPPTLKQEFATVEALWHSGAETRRVDSFLLSWVKYEKQLRRLFCFLVYQHPNITSKTINSVIGILAQSNNLYPDTFIRGIAALGVTPVPTLIGQRHQQLESEIARIKKYRNKLMHGQASGFSIQSAQLERDVKHIIEWIEALAIGADATFGYDGLRRNTFREAKANVNIAVAAFPFNTNAAFGKWLRAI